MLYRIITSTCNSWSVLCFAKLGTEQFSSSYKMVGLYLYPQLQMHHPPQRTIYVKVSLMVLRRWMPRCGKGSGEESCWTTGRWWGNEMKNQHCMYESKSYQRMDEKSNPEFYCSCSSSPSSPSRPPPSPRLIIILIILILIITIIILISTTTITITIVVANWTSLLLLLLFVSSVPGAFINLL